MDTMKIIDEFSQFRHKHYTKHGTLNGSYADLFRAIVRPGEQYSDLADTVSIHTAESEVKLPTPASIAETVQLLEESDSAKVGS